MSYRSARDGDHKRDSDPDPHGAAAGPRFPTPELTAVPELTTRAAEGLRATQALTFDGVEVTQVIQNMNHSVPLIENKSTLVRVYPTANLPFPVTLTGTLIARNPAGTGAPVTIPSVGNVVCNPGDGFTLNDKRNDVHKSLNFHLPEKLTRAGTCEVALTMLNVTVGVGMQTFPLPVAGAPKTKRTVTFIESPPLRLHIIGIRYTRNGNTYLPTAQDYALIRSWLTRAYPVAEVVWSQVTADAPAGFNLQASLINAFLRGIRATDVAAGKDHRTHYYGIVADGGGFMRGLASGIPNNPDPSTVASGPTGSSKFSWDTDGSYGDWYTGHELGHTFGRSHAEFCGARGGRPFPFVDGQLSNSDNEFVGFDVGDSGNGLPMQALPGVQWHDVMTYCQRQWLSSFTYLGIRERLDAENDLPTPGAVGGARVSANDAVHLIAVVNITRKTGSIQHVTPLAEANAAAQGKSSSFAIRMSKADGTVIGQYPAPFHPDACVEEDDDETGIVEATLSPNPEAAKLELLLDGVVLDTFARGATATAVRNIRAAAAPAVRALGSSNASPNSTTISWTDDAATTARAAPAGGAPTFSVQLSVDNGVTWHTIAFGLTTPQVELDHGLLEDAEKVMIRVTATDGFHSETSTQSFDLADL